MAKLAIRTSNFQLSYKLIKELRARKIKFEILDPSEKLPSADVIWFAESHEVLEHENSGKAIPTDVNNIEVSVDLALLVMKGLRNPKRLVFGIDPGPYPGLAWLADGVFIGVSQLQSIEEIREKIIAISNIISSQSLLIRIGDGDPLIRDRIINICISNNWNIEMVDETKTSKGLLRHNHSISALRISSMTGTRVWELRDIEPSSGQIKEIQRQSRKFTNGLLTISSEQAMMVAKGHFSLNEILSQMNYSSSED
jgi:hypothetical protein